MRVFRKQYWSYWISFKPVISLLLMLDLDIYCFIEVDFVAEGEF